MNDMCFENLDRAIIIEITVTAPGIGIDTNFPILGKSRNSKAEYNKGI